MEKEWEIDWATASASLSADPVLISKYAATVAIRSLTERKENQWETGSDGNRVLQLESCDMVPH